MGSLCGSQQDKSKQTKTEDKKERKSVEFKGSRHSQLKSNTNPEDQIHECIEVTQDFEVLKSILGKGNYEINGYFQNDDNNTLLTLSIRSNSTAEVINLILDNEADVDLIEKSSGHSPLILACLNLDLEIVELLLEKKPSLSIKSEDNIENMDILNYLNEKFSQNKFRGKNTWEQIREKLVRYIDSNKNRI